MKKYIPLALIIIALIAISGCIGQNTTGSGNVTNETRNASNFNQIDLNGAGEIILTQGNNESVIIEAEDGLMPYITTGVNNKKLSINFNAGMPVPTKPVKIYITVKDLNTINIAGAGKINSELLKVRDLTLSINGAGEANLNGLNANSFKSTISGSGKITASGSASNQNINIEGSGEYNAKNLTSKTTSISIDGAGKATVNVLNNLDVLITGSGTVDYIGSPKVTQKINGAGNVNKIQ